MFSLDNSSIKVGHFRFPSLIVNRKCNDLNIDDVHQIPHAEGRGGRAQKLDLVSDSNKKQDLK